VRYCTRWAEVPFCRQIGASSSYPTLSKRFIHWTSILSVVSTKSVLRFIVGFHPFRYHNTACRLNYKAWYKCQTALVQLGTPEERYGARDLSDDNFVSICCGVLPSIFAKGATQTNAEVRNTRTQEVPVTGECKLPNKARRSRYETFLLLSMHSTAVPSWPRRRCHSLPVWRECHHRNSITVPL